MTSSSGEIDVVAAVIRRDNRYLVCKRDLSKHHGGLWEFPGGKVSVGESFEDALYRELKEELDLKLLESGAILYSGSEPASPYLIHFVDCTVEGTPQALEHEEIEWLEIEKLGAVHFAPVDLEFVESGRLGAAVL